MEKLNDPFTVAANAIDDLPPDPTPQEMRFALKKAATAFRAMEQLKRNMEIMR